MGDKQEEINTIKVGDKVKFNQIGINHLRSHFIKENLSSNIQGEIVYVYVSDPDCVNVMWNNGFIYKYNKCYLEVIKNTTNIFIGIKFKNNEIKM